MKNKLITPPESAIHLQGILPTQFPDKPSANSGTVCFDDVKLIKLGNRQPMGKP
jgi:hypothetical protein